MNPARSANARRRPAPATRFPVVHPTTEELEASLDWILRSPADAGTLDLIVRRPHQSSHALRGDREVVDRGWLTTADGLEGDSWRFRRRRSAPHLPPDRDKQLTLINARLASAVAAGDGRRHLAGDQLFVDLDLSVANLPVGARLAIGDAVIEITPPPHRGCELFVERFGMEAMRFVNHPDRKDLRLRGAHARVVQPGTIHAGGEVVKVAGMVPAVPRPDA
jgi:hypothetical protein